MKSPILGGIFQRLNHGIEIEYLDLREKEYLCKFYGENWKEKVIQILNKHKNIEAGYPPVEGDKK